MVEYKMFFNLSFPQTQTFTSWVWAYSNVLVYDFVTGVSINKVRVRDYMAGVTITTTCYIRISVVLNLGAKV